MKMRILATLLCICVMLSACTAVPKDTQGTEVTTLATQETLNRPDTVEQPEQPERSEKGFVKAVYDELPVEHSYYQYGNMQINGPAGEYILYKDQVIFTAGGEQSLKRYAYDLNTGEVRLFCDLPGCDHKSGNCRRVGLAFGVVEQYDGILYGYQMNSPSKVLVDGQFEAMDCYQGSCWHAYGDLFVNANNRLYVYYDGTREPKLILKDYNYMWNVIFDGYLYGHSGEELVRVNLLEDNPKKEVLLNHAYCMIEGNHIYYVDTYVDTAEDSATYYLYRCDMDGSNSELLLDKPVLPASLNFDEQYVYFRLFTDHLISGTEDRYDIYRMSMAEPTQIEKIATLPETAYQIFTVPGEDLVFVVARGRYTGNYHIQNIYVMHSDGSDFRRLELP